jgi:hypothetical protein
MAAQITPIHSRVDTDTTRTSSIVQRFGGIGGDSGINAEAVTGVVGVQDVAIDERARERPLELELCHRPVTNSRRLSPR